MTTVHMTTVQIPGLLSFTIAIIVFFVGAGVNRIITPLERWNIPQAVTGGLVAALVTLIAFEVFHREISFMLKARDMLLLYFFTSVGLNAKLGDLVKGGRPLIILFGLTVVMLTLQNVIAALFSRLLALPYGFAPLVGSVSLMGGHGTTIAWAPTISARFGIEGALEAGIASATLGLVIGSLIGGPLAGFLIRRHDLSSTESGAAPMVGIGGEIDHDRDDVSYHSLMRTILVLNLIILVAFGLEQPIEASGVKLPLFVVCMLVSIIATNLMPRLAPSLRWPARTRGLALISDLSLNIFLAMSLMSMQLWTLGELGLRLVLVLAAQTVATMLFVVFVLFPALGRTYFAAVLGAGFAGIALGATPTGIANMTAVTRQYGPATRAFIILPLVSAFLIDIANALAISVMTR